MSDDDNGTETATGTAGPWVTCRKCRDRIRSEHRHDMRFCKCGAIAIDGGREYLRFVMRDSWDDVEYEEGDGE